jgi:nitrite reductase/ring-hydroxylating ferredoxin subunit
MQKRFEVCPTADLEPGDRTIVDLNGVSVGVFNVDGEYHALKNDCPHQRAPLCEGKVTGTTTAEEPGKVDWECDGHILRCPWHGWEFKIESGESVFNPHKVRARSFETAVESSGAETTDGSTDKEGCDCDVNLHGDEPPVDTYDTVIEDDQIVVYL